MNWPTYPICFWGCGAGLRRQALTNQPYIFDPRLLLHGTEMDLAVRLYAAGYVVCYTPHAVVHHRFSSENRSDALRFYFLVQNALWFGLKHLPVRFAVPAIGRHLAELFYRAIRKHCLRAFILGLLAGCRQIPSVLTERRPVPQNVARLYYEQVWEYEPIILRLMHTMIGWPPSRRDMPRGFPESQYSFLNGTKT